MCFPRDGYRCMYAIHLSHYMALQLWTMSSKVLCLLIPPCVYLKCYQVYYLLNILKKIIIIIQASIIVRIISYIQSLRWFTKLLNDNICGLKRYCFIIIVMLKINVNWDFPLRDCTFTTIRYCWELNGCLRIVSVTQHQLILIKLELNSST